MCCATQGYGSQPPKYSVIPPDADLTFVVELISAEDNSCREIGWKLLYTMFLLLAVDLLAFLTKLYDL